MAPLDTQIVPIAIQGGLAQEVEELALAPGQGWAELVNVAYDAQGVLRRRRGYDRLIRTYYGGTVGNLPAPTALHSLRGGLIAVAQGKAWPYPYLHSYTSDGWKGHDPAPLGTLSRKTLQRGSSYSAKNPHVCVVSDYTIYSWIAGTSLMLKILHTASGAVVVDERAGASFGFDPIRAHMTVACGDYALIFYEIEAGFGAGGLKVCRLDPSDGGISNATSVIGSQPLAWDAMAEPGDTALVAVAQDYLGSVLLNVTRWLPLDPPDYSTVGETVDWLISPSSVAIAQDETHTFVLVGETVIFTGVTLLRFTTTTLHHAHPFGNGNLVDSNQDAIYKVSLGCLDSGGWLIWYGVGENEGTDKAIWARSFDNAGTTVSDPRHAYWCTPYTRPWRIADTLYFVASDQTGEGYALLRLDEQTNDSNTSLGYLGGFCHLEAPGIRDAEFVGDYPIYHPTTVGSWPLTAPEDLGASRYLFPVLVPTVGNDLRSGLRGLDAITLDASTTQPYLGSAVEALGCLALNGTAAAWFDGQYCVEQGFHRSPVIFYEGTPVEGGDGHIAGAGSGSSDWNEYAYTAVYEWLDEAGNWHRSEPAPPVTFGVTGSQNNATITFRVKCLPLTAKSDGLNQERRLMRIAIYRTLANSPERFYRVDNPEQSTYQNDRGLAALEVVDTKSDAQLQAAGYGFLYTFGGVLENHPAPPARALALWKNRLWLASGDDPRAVWFSKQFVRTEAPGWNPILQVRLDEDAGDVVAMHPLSGSLLIWTATRTYYLTGEPPVDTGADNRLVGPELTSDAIGCLDPRSVVTFPGGVLFLGQPGFCLVQNVQSPPTFVGAPVKETTAQFPVCRGAVHDAARSRVLWVMRSTNGTDAVCVVFDYLRNAWSTFVQAVHSLPYAAHTLWQGKHTYADAQGVMVEAAPSSSNGDDGHFIPWRVTSPWLHLGSLDGYQRVRRVLFKFETPGYVKVTCSLYQDEEEDPSQETDLDMGAGGSQAQLPRAGWEVHVARQKCRSMRFSLLGQAGDVPEEFVGDLSRKFGLYSVSLEAGIKRGRDKSLPAENRR